MKFTPKMALSVGAALALITILVLVAYYGETHETHGETVEEEEVSDEIDEDLVEEQELVDQQMTAEPEPEPPATCATHTCPFRYEKDLDDVVGDTDEICCRKPLCDADTIQCPSNKIIKIGGSRGLDPSECCELPYCVDKEGGVCNSPSLKLKSGEPRYSSSSTADDECCDTLPSCSSHVCGSGYRNAPDAANRYGNTDGECCVLKTCGENKWGIANGRKCTSKGMKWIDDNADEVGNSEDACCIEATCFENGFNDDKCGNPRKGGVFGNTALMSTDGDEAVFGQTHDDCCAPSKCNEVPIVSCPSGKTYKTPVPYATSVEDCCEDIKCGGWFAADRTNNICPPHKKPKGDNDIGFNESQCCSVKTCSDVESDGTCPEGKSVTSTAPLPRDYGGTASDYVTSCCTDIKCNSPQSTFKTEAGCNEITSESLHDDVRDMTVATFALFKPINPLPADEVASQDKCCEEKLCSELTNLDCNKIGKKKDLQKNGSKWNHEDRGGKECCIEKTCEDLKNEGGMSCPVGQQEKDDLATPVTLDGDENSSEKLTEFQNTCCRGQKCSDITPDCSSISINGQTNVMVVDDSPEKRNAVISGTNHKACCKFKTCSQLGWDDAKCKDRNYTRAAYRGGLKTSAPAEGRPPTTDDNAASRDESEGWGYENLGDKHCCEHKPKTSSGGNYARQCVSKEYYKGTYKRKSPGVFTARFMGNKLNSRTLTVADADDCKTACNQNQSCTNFTMNRNGTCELFAGGSSGGTTALNRHGGVPLRGIIGIELGGGASAAAGRTRGTHYVTKNTFQNWSNGGHSTGNTSIGPAPWYTGKPKQDQISIGKGMTTDDINDDRVDQLTTNADAGACPAYSGQWGGHPNHPPGYRNRQDCENWSWKGRRDVLLAGVDEEFCPYDFFQGYDHSKSVGVRAGSDEPAVPASIGTDNMGRPAKGCKEMGTQNDGNNSYPTNDGKSTQQGINSCYSSPDCAYIFVNTSLYNPWQPLLTEENLAARRTDETSSRIGVSSSRNTMQSSHSRWARRICYGHHLSTYGDVTNPAANEYPGATLIKTRFKDTTDGNKKYTGRAPNKPTFSGAYEVENKILIAGDTAV